MKKYGLEKKNYQEMQYRRVPCSGLGGRMAWL